MGLLTDDTPLVDDSELDWSWTAQLWYVMTNGDDVDHHIVCARSAQEAVELYVKEHGDGTPHDKYVWNDISKVFKLPTEPGMTRVLKWYADIVPHDFVRPDFTSGGNK